MKNESKNDEINVLLPEQEVIVGDKTIIIREYSLRDSMSLYSEINVITTQISELFESNDAVHITAVESIFAKNYDILNKLIAHSTSTSIDFINSLDPVKGMEIIDKWWTVNASFFINAAARKLYQKAAIAKTQIGGKSSQH